MHVKSNTHFHPPPRCSPARSPVSTSAVTAALCYHLLICASTRCTHMLIDAPCQHFNSWWHKQLLSIFMGSYLRRKSFSAPRSRTWRTLFETFATSLPPRWVCSVGPFVWDAKYRLSVLWLVSSHFFLWLQDFYEVRLDIISCCFLPFSTWIMNLIYLVSKHLTFTGHYLLRKQPFFL